MAGTAALAVAALGVLPVAAAAAPVTPRPAAYGRDFPDPFVLWTGTSYDAFATQGQGRNVQVITSPDLAQWSALPDALPQLPSWSEPGFVWGPSVLRRPGGYVLYYATRVVGNGLQCISRATSATPAGPFRDTTPIATICQGDHGGSIDPSPFVDADGTPYLLWKSEGVVNQEPPMIWAQRLTDDGLDVVGSPTVLLRQDQPWEYPIIEGPTMVRHGGQHWLFYGGNQWASADYAIGMASCASVVGPCTKQGDAPVLSTSGDMAGPGGPETFSDQAGNLWFSYHAWGAGAVGYPQGQRLMHLAELGFPGGWPALDGVSLRPEPDPGGYRLVAADGGVFAFGTAAFAGCACPRPGPVVGGAATPDGGGYWWAAADGSVGAFGDAPDAGSAAGIPLTLPVVAMASTAPGHGYWLVAGDGGIFAFGDAAFHGSTGAMRLNRPVVGMAPTPSGGGYWLVASDGGIFAFGDAGFHGSAGGIALAQPVVALIP
ncbi:MAG TPA: glycoside hydrolase family 43 protein [Acidimicrobiales bacterium]